MISGLRMLPRVQAERQRQRDDGNRDADSFMDCTSCKALPDHATFAPEWRCGWLPEEDWKPGAMTTGVHDEAGPCPGYLAQLPEVLETAIAYQWREKGALDAVYSEMPLPPPAIQCIGILSGAIAEVEAETLRRIREEAERRGS